MNIAYVRFEIEFDFVLVHTENVRTVEGGGRVNHASVAIGETYYNIYNLKDTSTDMPIEYRYKFSEVFDR